ncbi:hypothetical protein QBD01_001664 [Ochrobactrum sp. 19YEA23]|nr:hypothetical protein [Ochrobactrum sp. 19YEA23]
MSSTFYWRDRRSIFVKTTLVLSYTSCAKQNDKVAEFVRISGCTTSQALPNNKLWPPLVPRKPLNLEILLYPIFVENATFK